MSRANVLRCSLAVVGLAVAAAAFGAQPAATPADSAQPGVAGTTGTTDGLVCRYRLKSGSHIKVRTCLTAAQRAARSMRDRGYAHEGAGPWGQGNFSTAGASVGMSAFT